MRALTTTLLLTAALGLTACHKKAEADADAPRGLKVETYDVPIAKMPHSGGKIGVMEDHPEGAASVVPPPVAASSAPPIAEPQPAPADKPQAMLYAPGVHRLPVLRVVAPAAAKSTEPRFDLYDSPTYRTDKPAVAQTAAEPGFRITVPMCRKAEASGDPLARTTECVSLLQQGRDQQRLCKQAFEDGNDQVALSDACRQSATFR